MGAKRIAKNYIFIYSYIHIFIYSIYSFGIFLQSAVDDVVAGERMMMRMSMRMRDIVGQCTVDVDIVRTDSMKHGSWCILFVEHPHTVVDYNLHNAKFSSIV